MQIRQLANGGVGGLSEIGLQERISRTRDVTGAHERDCTLNAQSSRVSSEADRITTWEGHVLVSGTGSLDAR
jgi:hypothetical protein